jgi:chaperonin GroES
MLQPLSNRVIIRPTAEDSVRESGLIIPEVAAEKPQGGVVLAVGPGAFTDKGVRVVPEVSEGDAVLYSKYGGTEIRVDGEDLIVIKESDVLAVIG